jgi:hypothetical protein
MTTRDNVISWSADLRSVLVATRELPLKVSRVDLQTGKRDLVRELMPSDSAGVSSVGPVCILPDQNSYVFGYQRGLSDLHVVQGLK